MPYEGGHSGTLYGRMTALSLDVMQDHRRPAGQVRQEPLAPMTRGRGRGYGRGEWVVNRVVGEEVQVDPVLLLRQLPPLAGQPAID